MVCDLSYPKCFCTCVDVCTYNSKLFLEGPGTNYFLNKKLRIFRLHYQRQNSQENLMFMYASSDQNKINVNEIIICRKKMTLIYIREKNLE